MKGAEQMDDKVLDEILATDEKIRYASVLGRDLKTVKSKTRKDIKLLLGEEADDKLASLISPIILSSLSQFTPKLGKLICCGVRFDKVTLMFFKMGDTHVVVSTEPVPPYNIMRKLEEKFQV